MKLPYNIRLFTLSFLVFATGVSGFCAPRNVPRGEESWRSMQEAEIAFSNGEYSEAVNYANEAKERRAQESEWQKYTLEIAQRRGLIRRAGDSLTRAVFVIQELSLNDALETVNFQFAKYGEDYFGGSFSRLIDFVDEYLNYPEADYLLGKIYRLEGEYQIAYDYMRNAYDHAALLDIPAQRYDLLYDLADLSLGMGDEDNYEKYLLVIISDDVYFRNSTRLTAYERTLASGDPDSMETFFLLYRHSNTTALEAFINLSRFYAQKNIEDRALRYAGVAAIIAVTRLEEVLGQRINGFRYTTFENLISRSSSYDDIVRWGSSTGVWDLFCELATYAADSGYNNFSNSLFTALSTSAPEYWRMYALAYLDGGTPGTGTAEPGGAEQDSARN